MDVYVTFRGDHQPPKFEMTTDQVEKFYQKVVRLRGAFKRVSNYGSSYIGMKIFSADEQWHIYREMVSVEFLKEDNKKIYFIDENREIERWIFNLFESHLSQVEIDTISSDLDEVIHYCGEYFCG